MTRYLLFIVILGLQSNGGSAQPIVNYDRQGNATACKADYLSISFNSSGRAFTSILSGIAGPLVSLGVDLVNTIKKNRDQKYTACYANSTVSRFSDMADLVGKKMIVRRMIIADEKDDGSGRDSRGSDFLFSINESNNMLTLSLDSFSFYRSRAKFKDPNDYLSLNIDVQITGYYQEDKKPTLTSVNLGEANFLIPLLKPGYTEKDIKYQYNQKANFLSLIPPSPGHFFLATKVTITEVNSQRLSPKLVSSLLANNGSDVSALLKAIITAALPGSSSTSSSKQ